MRNHNTLEKLLARSTLARTAPGAEVVVQCPTEYRKNTRYFRSLRYPSRTPALAAILAGWAGGGPSTKQPPAAVARHAAERGLDMQRRSGADTVAPSRKGLGTTGTLPIPLTRSLD